MTPIQMSSMSVTSLLEGVNLCLISFVGMHLLYRYMRHRAALLSNPYELFLMGSGVIAEIALMTLPLLDSQLATLHPHTASSALTKLAILTLIAGLSMLVLFGIWASVYGYYLSRHKGEVASGGPGSSPAPVVTDT